MTDPYGENSISKTTFAIIGVGGYIAPKHLKAIKDNNGELVAALDINDSVGILDQYFINAKFHNKEKDFFTFLQNNPVDYVSICSPNYLHKHHIEQSMLSGANIICEKPLVLKTSDILDLLLLEKKTQKKIYNILQLRLHPSIIELKNHIQNNNYTYIVDLEYITARGDWYFKSWKGDPNKSGGLLMNIGIHFFDVLSYLFGKMNNFTINQNEANKIRGTLSFEQSFVDWFLSIDINDIPAINQKVHRKLLVNGKAVDLNQSFTDLHTTMYSNILNGTGYTIKDVAYALEMISTIGKYCESQNI